MTGFTTELRTEFEHSLRELAENSLSKAEREAYALVLKLLNNNESLEKIKVECARHRADAWAALEHAEREHRPLVDLGILIDTYAVYRLVLAFLSRYDKDEFHFSF